MRAPAVHTLRLAPLLPPGGTRAPAPLVPRVPEAPLGIKHPHPNPAPDSLHLSRPHVISLKLYLARRNLHTRSPPSPPARAPPGPPLTPPPLRPTYRTSCGQSWLLRCTACCASNEATCLSAAMSPWQPASCRQCSAFWRQRATWSWMRPETSSACCGCQGAGGARGAEAWPGRGMLSGASPAWVLIHSFFSAGSATLSRGHFRAHATHPGGDKPHSHPELFLAGAASAGRSALVVRPARPRHPRPLRALLLTFHPSSRRGTVSPCGPATLLSASCDLPPLPPLLTCLPTCVQSAETRLTPWK